MGQAASTVGNAVSSGCCANNRDGKRMLPKEIITYTANGQGELEGMALGAGIGGAPTFMGQEAMASREAIVYLQLPEEAAPERAHSSSSGSPEASIAEEPEQEPTGVHRKEDIWEEETSPAAVASARPPSNPPSSQWTSQTVNLADYYAKAAYTKAFAEVISHRGQTRPAEFHEEEERRLDPEGNIWRTLRELHTAYGDRFSPQEIEAYWVNSCMRTSSEVSARPIHTPAPGQVDEAVVAHYNAVLAATGDEATAYREAGAFMERRKSEVPEVAAAPAADEIDEAVVAHYNSVLALTGDEATARREAGAFIERRRSSHAASRQPAVHPAVVAVYERVLEETGGDAVRAYNAAATFGEQLKAGQDGPQEPPGPGPGPGSPARGPGPAATADAEDKQGELEGVGNDDPRKEEGRAREEEAAPGGASAEWIVVGGTGSGGLVVRETKDLKSPEVARLGTGARIQEIARDGERLRFRKLHGAGPESGWISTSIRNRDTISPA